MPTALIIGAGIGGLATAIRLQVMGFAVQVFEAQAGPGGKLNTFALGEYRFDQGPSLFTMPELVEDLFATAQVPIEPYFQYQRLPVITHYFYPDGTQLHAHADPQAFADELQAKLCVNPAQIRAFLAASADKYTITAPFFLERSLNRWSTFCRWSVLPALAALPRLELFKTMNQSNAQRFDDPKLVQLFNRYATYNGSDPYQAPATLNIIPHLEFGKGAYFPVGGMYSITQALYQLATDLGVRFHFNTPVTGINVTGKKATGIQIAAEKIAADVVVSNMDFYYTYKKLMPGVAAPKSRINQPRSSSALIYYWGINKQFSELDLHNIFFSKDYQREFQAIFQQRTIDSDPTIYVNISSKYAPNDAPKGAENWFVLINAPHDAGQDWPALVEQTRGAIFDKLQREWGYDISSKIDVERVWTPKGIEADTRSYTGSLYGTSSNNRMAAFLRHPNRNRNISGLYFVGGSVHPGGGIPLCLWSAKIAADWILSREGKNLR
jgi:diapolycopene oxygenase